MKQDFERDIVHVDEMDRTCPNSLHLFPASVRRPLRNMVEELEDVYPRRAIKRRLSAAQFQVNEYLKISQVQVEKISNTIFPVTGK